MYGRREAGGRGQGRRHWEVRACGGNRKTAPICESCVQGCVEEASRAGVRPRGRAVPDWGPPSLSHLS